MACAFSAFSYAELSSAIGGSGSAYGYTYAGMGEFFAWLAGWSMILDYGVVVSAVAIGWSGYFNDIIAALGWHLPASIANGPSAGGIIDLPAVLIILALTGIQCLGVQQGIRFNNVIVFIKFLVIGIFVATACTHLRLTNWQPFMPFGWHGILQGAAIIFFAYNGFDAVSTAAEEAINPQRDLPKGIIGSLLICALIYIAVSGLLTGIEHYSHLNNPSPVAKALLDLGHPITAGIVAAGIIAGLTTVILVMFYGLTRIFFAISRDGLLPPVFSRIHPKTQSPVHVIIISGGITALIAGFVPMGQIAELVNISVLATFAIVSAAVIVLRINKPELHRPFKTPGYPIIPILGIMLCFYLMLNLSGTTWWQFGIWMAIGIVIYFSYSYKHSALNK